MTFENGFVQINRNGGSSGSRRPSPPPGPSGVVQNGFATGGATCTGGGLQYPHVHGEQNARANSTNPLNLSNTPAQAQKYQVSSCSLSFDAPPHRRLGTEEVYEGQG